MSKPHSASVVERLSATDQLDKLEVTGSSPVTPIASDRQIQAAEAGGQGLSANVERTALDPREAGLDHLWHFHRKQLLMLGEGATASVDTQRTHESKNPSKAPKDAGQELQELDRRWAGCKTVDDKRAVISEAQEVLRGFKFPKADPTTIRDTIEWKKSIAKDERPIAMVAQFWGVSERTVSKYRAMFKEEM